MLIPYLNRINELSRKQSNSGLTDQERSEQKELRQNYLKMIRGQVQTTMLAVSVVDSKGNDVTPSKLVDEKKILSDQNR
ncbi:Uncharacterized protein YnzC, UPF0291/DUF896 family [Paenibacillus algorifonticola]|uniref:UPF0291 protein SAMN04487969_11231 n=1 Tax=Paenibacillus algorifonticola TaxID=684063 RepID=A0A1I2FGI9_9BACL|nr:DUF896 domain-containing protein [Paenibacillus algorifonticola]SFF04029.1 Uncharacterized protein YnzC, UPF0291/DUF896 family [Paenibacillus algorifonticola]